MFSASRLYNSFLSLVGPAVDPISLYYRTTSDQMGHLIILTAERTRFPREDDRYLELRTRAPKFIIPYIAEVNRNIRLCLWVSYLNRFPFRRLPTFNTLPMFTLFYYFAEMNPILVLCRVVPYDIAMMTFILFWYICEVNASLKHYSSIFNRNTMPSNSTWNRKVVVTQSELNTA